MDRLMDTIVWCEKCDVDYFSDEGHLCVPLSEEDRNSPCASAIQAIETSIRGDFTVMMVEEVETEAWYANSTFLSLSSDHEDGPDYEKKYSGNLDGASWQVIMVGVQPKGR